MQCASCSLVRVTFCSRTRGMSIYIVHTYVRYIHRGDAVS